MQNVRCSFYLPWDRYDSYCISIAECEWWSGDFCQYAEAQRLYPECPKEWIKKPIPRADSDDDGENYGN